MTEIFFDYFPGKKTVQTFDDRGVNKTLARIIHFDKVTVGVMKDLERLNSRGAGIYMCINETDGKGRRASNVIKVRSCYADLDGSPLEVALAYQPSMVVESSPGKYHCYWFARDVPLQAFSEVQKNIIRALGSDPAVHDLPRVLRVPGFYHQKKEPFLTRIVSHTGDIFKYRDLVAFFPPVQRQKWSAKKYNLDKRPAGAEGYKGNYGASNGSRNVHIFKRIGGMMKRGKSWDYIEQEAAKENQACNPPLEVEEFQSLLRSARRYYV